MNITKRFLAFLVCAAMTLGFVCIPAAAADSGKTYSILTAQELADIKGSGSYCLGADIDMTGFDWDGIRSFSGKLDGNGFAIKNLSSDTGLFGTLKSGALIKDIRLENCEIVSDSKYIGAIATYIPADAVDVQIINCSVNGIVQTRYAKASRMNFCGALVGIVKSQSALISQCRSSAVVSAKYGIGGLVGLNYGKVENSAFTGVLSHYGYDHEHCNCGEEHRLLAYTARIQGGVCAVNRGQVTGCAVLAYMKEAEYIGMISGIDIKGYGSVTNCAALNDCSSWTEYADKYSTSSNVLSSSAYKKIG